MMVSYGSSGQLVAVPIKLYYLWRMNVSDDVNTNSSVLTGVVEALSGEVESV